MAIPSDLAELLPPRVAHERDDRPIYFLFTFDPTDGQVYLDHTEDKHPADVLTHRNLAPHVTHPERVHGYAYSIEGGWRLTTDEHRKIEDPYIERRVLKALRQEEPEADLPHIRYHGAP